MVIWQVEVNSKMQGYCSTQTEVGIFDALLEYLPIEAQGRIDFILIPQEDSAYRALLSCNDNNVVATSLDVVFY